MPDLVTCVVLTKKKIQTFAHTWKGKFDLKMLSESLGSPCLSDHPIANSLLESHLQLKVNESQVENCVKTVCLSHIYLSIAPSRCEFETHGEENNHDRAEVKMLSKLLQMSDPMIAKSVLQSHLGIKTEPTI